MILANLKKSGRVGTWGVNKYLFLGSFFSCNILASVDYIYLRVGRVRPGEGVGGSRPI